MKAPGVWSEKPEYVTIDKVSEEEVCDEYMTTDHEIETVFKLVADDSE